MHRMILILFVAISLAFSLPASAAAQQADMALSVEYQFGEYVDFIGVLPEGLAVSNARLFFLARGESTTRSAAAQVSGRQLTYRAGMQANPLRAFVDVLYWFEVTLVDGGTLSSQQGNFQYIDNRYEWQSRHSDRFHLYYYEGDSKFAQAVLDAAETGLENIRTFFPVEMDKPVDIYAYASAQEMRTTLQSFSHAWVGAHADPDLGVMVISLPKGPEQRLEMERQVPHELMHILLYRRLGSAYANLPAWLNEGLGSVAELYPNPDYVLLIERALQKGTLLPLASLCTQFPRDASGTFLAYAQSASFTRFLLAEYGNSGLESLLQAYADGLGCEQGVQAATGNTLTQLERDWRGSAFGENAWLSVLWKLLPWVLLLLVAVGLPLLLALRRPVASNSPAN